MLLERLRDSLSLQQVLHTRIVDLLPLSRQLQNPVDCFRPDDENAVEVSDDDVEGMDFGWREGRKSGRRGRWRRRRDGRDGERDLDAGDAGEGGLAEDGVAASEDLKEGGL